uniref:(northern house mosquito) hypothetical protein n=1 Tax=Culex pipiens TaxID=7175 RepID=A0A8D8DCM9_CULPI
MSCLLYTLPFLRANPGGNQNHINPSQEKNIEKTLRILYFLNLYNKKINSNQTARALSFTPPLFGKDVTKKTEEINGIDVSTEKMLYFQTKSQRLDVIAPNGAHALSKYQRGN